MEAILELQNVVKQYGRTGFALQNVSLAVPYGCIMGLVGENGAGKTTTIGCILNALRRDSGEIRLFGRAMTDADTAMREDLGVVFEAGCFSGALTPAQLASVLRGVYRQWDDALYTALLRRFELPEQKKLRTFSRGMSMKLSIAAALSHRPRLLILDEATSGLDPVVRDEILDVFLDFVQDERHSVLLSSHITSDLEKVADYITFLHRGAVILSETKDALLYDYAVARCKAAQFEAMERTDIVAYRKRDYQTDVLVKSRHEAQRRYRDVVLDAASIDDMLLLLAKGERV